MSSEFFTQLSHLIMRDPVRIRTVPNDWRRPRLHEIYHKNAVFQADQIYPELFLFCTRLKGNTYELFRFS